MLDRVDITVNNTMIMRNKLLAKLHCVINQKGISQQNKEDIYSGYGVDSARDLTDAQVIQIINALTGVSAKNDYRKNSYGDPPIKAMRSEILKLITGASCAASERSSGLGVPNDWQILNPFIEYHAGKLLPAMNMDEMIALKKKLYALRKKGWRYKVAAEPNEKLPRQVKYIIVSQLSKVIN